jgi:hypothetical protein
MLDIHAAIKYLQKELQGIEKAIGNLEAIATDHYSERKRRTRQNIVSADRRQLKGKNRLADKFLVPLPSELNPDAYLWLN